MKLRTILSSGPQRDAVSIAPAGSGSDACAATIARLPRATLTAVTRSGAMPTATCGRDAVRKDARFFIRRT